MSLDMPSSVAFIQLAPSPGAIVSVLITSSTPPGVSLDLLLLNQRLDMVLSCSSSVYTLSVPLRPTSTRRYSIRGHAVSVQRLYAVHFLSPSVYTRSVTFRPASTFSQVLLVQRLYAVHFFSPSVCTRSVPIRSASLYAVRSFFPSVCTWSISSLPTSISHCL